MKCDIDSGNRLKFLKVLHLSMAAIHKIVSVCNPSSFSSSYMNSTYAPPSWEAQSISPSLSQSQSHAQRTESPPSRRFTSVPTHGRSPTVKTTKKSRSMSESSKSRRSLAGSVGSAKRTPGSSNVSLASSKASGSQYSWDRKKKRYWLNEEIDDCPIGVRNTLNRIDKQHVTQVRSDASKSLSETLRKAGLKYALSKSPQAKPEFLQGQAVVESKNNDDDVLACSNEKLGDPKGFEDPFTSAEMDETAVNGQDDVSIASTLKTTDSRFGEFDSDDESDEEEIVSSIKKWSIEERDQLRCWLEHNLTFIQELKKDDEHSSDDMLYLAAQVSTKLKRILDLNQFS